MGWRWVGTSRWAACVAALGSTACEDEAPGACNGVGEPAIELRQRSEDVLIVDGAELPVFPPPQGGVWTEIDVRLLGVTLTEVESLNVEVVDGESATIGGEFYLGDGLPLACRDDGSIAIDNMPVGFGSDPMLLEELDGLGATMTTTLVHPAGETKTTISVTIRADSY